MQLNGIGGAIGVDHPALEALLTRFNNVKPGEMAGRPPQGISVFSHRHKFEAEWLLTLPGIGTSVAAVLAARTTAAAMRLLPFSEHLEASAYPVLLADRPTKAAFQVAGVAIETEPNQTDIDNMARLWPLAVPAEVLLASGGDDRLSLSGNESLNRYGCTPWPRPEVIGFGSCTASSPSTDAFVEVEQSRRSLIARALATGADQAIREAALATETAILDHFQVNDLASAILTASGTDAALAITGLLVAERPDVALTSVLVSPSETGSGVPLAVQGRHFAGLAPDGRLVCKGDAAAGLAQLPSLATIALRDAAGEPRSASEIAGDCEDAIMRAVATGRAVLHAIDGSKTGLTAPDRPALLRLRKRFGTKLDIVIDACQARIEPVLVRWYLTNGFPVLVTGSKFFGAPGFCGAVLFPRTRLARVMSEGRMPAGISAYTGGADGFGSRLCPGLLLRWAAALHEMKRFARLSPEDVGSRLGRLGHTAIEAIANHRRLRLVAAPRPAGMGWSDKRSVFTFAVRAQDGWMDPARLRRQYLALQEKHGSAAEDGFNMSAIYQIGQPVELGSPRLGGLRIAFSASQVASDEDFGPMLNHLLSKLDWLLDADGMVPPAGFHSRTESLVNS